MRHVGYSKTQVILLCYAKKVRCDLRDASSRFYIVFCQMVCQTKRRSSIRGINRTDGASISSSALPTCYVSSRRSNLDDPHSRARSLEGASGIRRPSSEQSPGDIAYVDATKSRQNSNLLEISPINQELGQDRVPGEESTSMTAGYRGATSPWTAWVNGTSQSSESGSMRPFQQTAKRLTEEDSIGPNPIRQPSPTNFSWNEWDHRLQDVPH